MYIHMGHILTFLQDQSMFKAYQRREIYNVLQVKFAIM